MSLLNSVCGVGDLGQENGVSLNVLLFNHTL